MYGNDRLPGFAVSEPYRAKGSIWQGAPEATWFKTVSVGGDEEQPVPISAGIIMKSLTDGSYSPINESDILSVIADLPGPRLVIVADKSATSGTTTTIDEQTVATPSSVLVGICGVVDKNKLLLTDKAFTDLSDEQQINLSIQLEAWSFMLVDVLQA